MQVEAQITAPAHTLYEIVRKLPEGAEVSLLYSGDDPRLVVSAGRSRFNLPVLPAGDFPVMSTESARRLLRPAQGGPGPSESTRPGSPSRPKRRAII